MHTTSQSSPILELQDISVRFGGIHALNGVGFSVLGGETLGLIGPNGAGKTTLFDVIAGVRRPDQGRVLLDQRDVTGRSEAERARKGLRRTFQRVQTFGWLSVEDNILVPLDCGGGGGGFLGDIFSLPARGRREKSRRRRVAEVVELCGLQGVRRELAAGLPIGVARMVELARAIIDQPRLLLLDEPASGLDDDEVGRLGAQIQALTGAGCAIVLVEHDMAFVMKHSDRVIVLNQGAVLAEGLPEDIKRNPAVRVAYLGADHSGEKVRTA
ncbi:ABC transporter ATP-binding protein [Acrocarpospora catenulata]|uniref:ABC transporter ATP-binding protein n=1 Tax=Acrocarpospora catenulata TaxID=2836182 RepID=UPI002023A041|nr:ABC transporter ATP-binding protein [Acrocarpospora catenulata]